MTSQEFSLWQKFHAESPIDDSRGDLNTGIICSTIANYAGRIRNEEAGQAKPSDFMPFLERPEEVPTEEHDVLDFFTAQAALFDAKGKPKCLS